MDTQHSLLDWSSSLVAFNEGDWSSELDAFGSHEFDVTEGHDYPLAPFSLPTFLPSENAQNISPLEIATRTCEAELAAIDPKLADATLTIPLPFEQVSSPDSTNSNASSPASMFDLQPSSNTAPRHRGNYKCRLRSCSESFTCKPQRDAHFAEQHSNGKTYACSACSMIFLSQSNLSKHQRRHDAVKPYACSCGKLFVQSNQRKDHIKRKTNTGSCYAINTQ
jgi:hypothetical protein